MASIQKRGSRWFARYRDDAGHEHGQRFDRKVDAQRWLDEATAALQTGTYVDPKTARTTAEQWYATWLAGEGLADSYVHALHNRLGQVFSDAVHDGIVSRSPCSRRTSPGCGKQRPYVASTEQVWALVDAVHERYRAGILLGAFAGLRVAEVCGLRVADVDFMRGVIHQAVQYPAEPLKTEVSRPPSADPGLNGCGTLRARRAVRWRSNTLLTNAEHGGPLGPWILERAVRTARGPVGPPAGFRHHDEAVFADRAADTMRTTSKVN